MHWSSVRFSEMGVIIKRFIIKFVCASLSAGLPLSVSVCASLREAAKKVLLLMARPLRGGGGGGVKGLTIKEKRTFFGTFFSSVPKLQRPLSSKREGG